MPPLRERREDIPLLASYFAGKYAGKVHRQIKGFSPDALECLGHHAWPGNVRELENAIEHAVTLGVGDIIRPEDLPESLFESDCQGDPGLEGSTHYHQAVKEAKKQVVLQALSQTGGSFTEAANLLGVHPNYLHRLVNNLGLRPSMSATRK